MPGRLGRTLGRRGTVLLLNSLLWFMTGWSVAVMPYPAGRNLAPHEFAPVGLRVTGWVLTAVIAVICAFNRRWDRWGFFALMFMPAERAFSWVLVIILYGFHQFGMTPWPLPPFAAAWAGAAVWLDICLYILCIALWLEDRPEVNPIRDLIDAPVAPG